MNIISYTVLESKHFIRFIENEIDFTSEEYGDNGAKTEKIKKELSGIAHVPIYSDNEMSSSNAIILSNEPGLSNIKNFYYTINSKKSLSSKFAQSMNSWLTVKPFENKKTINGEKRVPVKFADEFAKKGKLFYWINNNEEFIVKNVIYSDMLPFPSWGKHDRNNRDLFLQNIDGSSLSLKKESTKTLYGFEFYEQILSNIKTFIKKSKDDNIFIFAIGNKSLDNKQLILNNKFYGNFIKKIIEFIKNLNEAENNINNVHFRMIDSWPTLQFNNLIKVIDINLLENKLIINHEKLFTLDFEYISI